MMQNNALKQLSYFGKKSVPPTVRRDMWQPLLTVCFPEGREQEGLIAYQRLREYRMVRDVNWRKREDLLEHAAFSKIKLKSRSLDRPRSIWNARRRILMNQKAEAVADVAAVLARQEGIEAAKKAKEEERKAEEVQRLEKLREDAKDAKKQKAIESNIRNLQKALQRGRGKGADQPARTEETQKEWEKTVRKDLGRLTWKKGLLRQAIEAVKQSETPQSTQEPILRNIRIQWLDIQDADYAKSWPDDVLHDTMGGIPRFMAPHPELEKQPLFFIGGKGSGIELTDEEKEHMESNVELDGEANEEGGKDKNEADEQSSEKKNEDDQSKKDTENLESEKETEKKEATEQKEASTTKESTEKAETTQETGPRKGVWSFLTPKRPQETRDSSRP